MNNTNTKDDFKTRLLECFEKGSVNNNESVKQTLGSIMEETACKSNRIREQECKQDEY